MKDWERIKKIRTDMSEYVLHWTRASFPKVDGQYRWFQPYDVLKLILKDGFLKASFAQRGTLLGTQKKPSVRGPYRAVCYTEQPLRVYLESIKASKQSFRGRYAEFAVAVQKDQLYHYGGRPVIYSGEDILGDRLDPSERVQRGYPQKAWAYEGGLPDDLQYLWVNYDPTALWRDRKYPIDFTHEREWRARANVKLNQTIGLGEHADDVVPLHLPTGVTNTPAAPRFVIVVDTEMRKSELADWIRLKSQQIRAQGAYWLRYGTALLTACESDYILSFEMVEEDDNHRSLGRIEDFISLENETPEEDDF